MKEDLVEKLEESFIKEMVNFVETSAVLNFVDGLTEEQKFAELRNMFNFSRIKSMELVDYDELFLDEPEVE